MNFPLFASVESLVFDIKQQCPDWPAEVAPHLHMQTVQFNKISGAWPANELDLKVLQRQCCQLAEISAAKHKSGPIKI
jgi:hypothetical protein